MDSRPLQYLAHFPGAGDALFTRCADAKEWCNDQARYRHPGRRVSWVSSEHGWEAQRWDTHLPVAAQPGGTVTGIVLDGTLPEADDEDDDTDYACYIGCGAPASQQPGPEPDFARPVDADY